MQVAGYTWTHTYTLDPKKSVGLNMLSKNSVEINKGKSAYATRHGTRGHSRLSSLSHCGLILAKKWDWCAQADFYFKKKKIFAYIYQNAGIGLTIVV